MSHPEDTPKAPDGATLTIPGLPDGDNILDRAIVLANAAKSVTWQGMDFEDGKMPEDHMFLRGALALLHMLSDSCQVSLLATSFTVVDNDPPARADLLATRLDDPGRFLADAVANNRRLLGLPPQLIDTTPLACERCRKPIASGETYCIVRTPDAEVPVHHGCMGGRSL